MVIRKMLVAGMAVVTGMTLSATAFAATTDTQKCGAAIGKALSHLENSIGKEAARACGTGKAVNNGKAATEGRTGAAAARFNTKRAQAYEKFNQASSCPDVNEVIAQSVLDEATARSTDLCTVGTDIPLPTE